MGDIHGALLAFIWFVIHVSGVGGVQRVGEIYSVLSFLDPRSTQSVYSGRKIFTSFFFHVQIVCHFLLARTLALSSFYVMTVSEHHSFRLS